MIPKGYYLLSESGVKEALTAKINALAFEYQLKETRNIVAQKDTVILVQKRIIVELQAASSDDRLAARTLRRKLFWNTLETWTLRALVVHLIFNK